LIGGKGPDPAGRFISMPICIGPVLLRLLRPGSHRGDLVTRMALEGDGRARNHRRPVIVEEIGPDDIITDGKVALGLDEKAPGGAHRRLPDQEIVEVDAQLAPRFSPAGHEYFTAVDLDSLDKD